MFRIRSVKIDVIALWVLLAHGFFFSEPAGADQKTPFTVFVLNREDQSIYVYPPEGLALFQSDPLVQESARGFAHVSALNPVGPMPATLADPELINSLAKPLVERAPVYVQTILRQLEPLKPVLVPQWTVTALKVVSRARGFESLRARGVSSWPMQIPLQLTELADPVALRKLSDGQKGPLFERAMLVLVEVRADSTAGAVEQIDFLSFGPTGVARTYWSRDLLDPTYYKPVAEVFAEAGQKFIERVKAADPALNEPAEENQQLELLVHRTIDVSVIEKIQRALDSFKSGRSLKAHGFDRDFINYRVALTEENLKQMTATLRDWASSRGGFELRESTNESGQVVSLQLSPDQSETAKPAGQSPSTGKP